MDHERLHAAATNAVASNTERYREEQAEINATNEARQLFADALSQRQDVYKELAAVAVANFATWDATVVQSQALPVGEITLTAPDGETVTRRMHAVIETKSNDELTHDDELDMRNVRQHLNITPDRITISFAVEAEDGDEDRGLLRVQRTGAREGKVVAGQWVDTETFELMRASVSAELKGVVGAFPHLYLEEPVEGLHKNEANNRAPVVIAETAAMRRTLDLILTGREAQVDLDVSSASE